MVSAAVNVTEPPKHAVVGLADGVTTNGGAAVIFIALLAGAAKVGNDADVNATDVGQFAKATTDPPTFGTKELSCAITKY